jgi:hypothetical protein
MAEMGALPIIGLKTPLKYPQNYNNKSNNSIFQVLILTPSN